MNQLLDLTHPVVRDLAWAIFSPNLVSDFAFHPYGKGVQPFTVALTSQRIRWLYQLDHQPELLLNHLEHLRSSRLGVYFEALWRFFIQQDSQYDLAAANLPVTDGGTTLGEFDLLFFDLHSGNGIHLELATKYYLNTLAPTELEVSADFYQLRCWLGPNCRDRLDIKLQRALSHQARLSELPQSEIPLRNLGMEHAIKAVAIKGCLFYQREVPDGLGQFCAPLDPHHWRGCWNKTDELGELSRRAEYWHILQRPRWLSPARLDRPSQTTPELIRSHALEHTLGNRLKQEDARPILICALEEIGEKLVETERLMIAPSSWPSLEP